MAAPILIIITVWVLCIIYTLWYDDHNTPKN